ncbi:MAG: hypothetical protein K5879_07465 [Lachnospiraceae bacterium]|nr:hypothetical protein [Lachnospiraceae bacterium]
MGIFNIKEITGKNKKKLVNFRASLGEAVRLGKEIPFADKDINYSLQLQNERLREKGIDLESKIYIRDGDTDKFFSGRTWKDAHYESTMCYNGCGIKRVVKKNGKWRYTDNKKSVLYETVTDVVSGTHPDNDPVNCPNCGMVSTAAALQDGCSYCGTKFRMDDLFPKVSSYYFLDDAGMTKKEFLHGYLISYFITLILLYVLACFLRSDIYLPQNLIQNKSYLITTLIAMPLGSIPLGYILYGYFLFIRMIAKAIMSAGKMGTAGSRRSFESRMKKISPEFSYEYFTSKAISLIKTAIYSKNPQDLLFYTGKDLDPGMKDIIDLNYGGALGCKSFRDEGNMVRVVTKAYFDVLYADGDRIYSKSQVFSATFIRRTDLPVNLNFSMTRIQCPTCGSSFDATKNKNCPYCENPYEITTDDWALVELKYN